MRFQISLVLALLVCSTSVCSAQSKLPSDTSGTIAKISTLEKARAAHTATRLLNGHVLILGGMEQNGVFHADAEIFDPAENTFTTLENSLTKKRVNHTATLLNDGRVLIVGGWSNRTSPDNTAEIFDSKTQRFVLTGEMKNERAGHTATLLLDGKVLIAGGNDGERSLDGAELFDPETNVFKPAGKMKIARKIHTASRLNDGKVLMTGGDSGSRTIIAETEVYDPETNEFTKLSAKMNVARYKHDAVVLGDGRVLIFGGSDARDWRGRTKSAEVFDPLKEEFQTTSEMNFARFKIAETAIVLGNGNVLIAGGSGEAEVFDTKENIFKRVSGNFGDSMHFATTTLLKDGRALVVGGYAYQRGAAPKSTNQAWIFGQKTIEVGLVR